MAVFLFEPGEPRLYTNQNQPHARIATALVIAALAIIVTAPSAAADDPLPSVSDEGVTYGPCAGVEVGEIPPSYYVDVWSCFPA